MGLIVTENAFTKREQAIDEIKAANLWLLELVLEPGERDTHWHDFYAQDYILEGELILKDEALGVEHRIGPGTRLIAPPRWLHSEKMESPVKLLIGLSIDPATLPENIDLSPAELQRV
ncbi:MAG: hypothetical protein DRR06_03560 [Gammaproteobacteria bacterium]|nr:MAG: hypothetical protein DRR06_03560 [Gammaproteobacteria bacterium]RLA50087.1 MAG: hypothetical protein DRR42_14105 [Gammaproteobacteria bacterium]